MILKNGKRIDGLGDNMPIGSIVEYNGTDIPDGWEILPGDANVCISQTEPTEKQEVWIKRGKNLLDRNKCKNGWGLTSNLESQGFVADANWFLSHPILVEAGKPYYSSGLFFANGDTQTFKEFYDINHNFISNTKDNPAVAPDNAVYMYVDGRIDKGAQAMVIQGSSSIPYEPYIEKTILIKNDNEVYEQFYNEGESESYSYQERKIGTWLNGKPLYQRTYVFTLGDGVRSANIDLNIDNLDTVFIDSGASLVEYGLWSTVQLGFYAADTDFTRGFISGDKTYIGIAMGTAYTNGEKVVTTTIKYTKTTD